MIKIILYGLLINLSVVAFSQSLPRPEIDFVTVDHSAGKVFISWSVAAIDDIDGYYVKRLMYDGINVVPNTCNTVETIENANQTIYLDTSTAYSSESLPNQRVESYSIVAFRHVADSLVLSTMSKMHSTIYLQVEFDTCKNENILKWAPYKGRSVNTYHIFCKTESISGFQKIVSLPAADTIYRHPVTSGQNYQYYVAASDANDTFSVSNIKNIQTYQLQKPEFINADYATVENSNEIKLSFTIGLPNDTKHIVLLKSNDSISGYDSINWSPQNTGNIVFIDNDLTTQRHYYKLAANNQCNEKFEFSNVCSNIVLGISACNSSAYCYKIFWDKYFHWQSPVSEYRIYRSIANRDFEFIASVNPEDTSYLDEIELDVLSSAEMNESGKICYQVEAVESDFNPYNIKGISKSNIVCDVLPVVVFVPNAFNPNSLTEENRVFKPKLLYAADYLLAVYSRFGNKIFETTNPHNGWTGKTNGGSLCQQGVYTWYIQYKDKSGKKITKTGYVNLVY